jgi:hypothetical protein
MELENAETKASEPITKAPEPIEPKVEVPIVPKVPIDKKKRNEGKTYGEIMELENAETKAKEDEEKKEREAAAAAEAPAVLEN